MGHSFDVNRNFLSLRSSVASFIRDKGGGGFGGGGGVFIMNNSNLDLFL